MHQQQTINQEVYDATKTSPAAIKEEKATASNPTARKVGHYLIALLALSFIISSCQSYQHPDLEIRQLGFQLTPEQDAYLDTANAFAVLRTVRGTKHKLDSLLTWTDMLKDHDEERALIYANEAYRLGTEKNYRLSRAIAMYYRALLKGRGKILGEGVDDALADLKISRSLINKDDPVDWQVQNLGLIGHLYHKTFDKDLRDSAIHYELKALELTQKSILSEEQIAYFKGQIFLDLANIYAEAMPDSTTAAHYFKSSEENALIANNDFLLLRIWRDRGVFYSGMRDEEKAALAFKKSLQIGASIKEGKGLISTYQRLGDLMGMQYLNPEVDSFFLLSNQYLRKCLEIHMKTGDHSTLYYTYLLLAYNYNVHFELNSNAGRVKLDAIADSALYYYTLAMEEAGDEGVLRIMPSAVKNISSMCSLKKKLTGEDCEELLVTTKGDYYFKFINENYDNLVNTVRVGLASSNERVRQFETSQADAINSFRINRNWTISAGSLLFAVLLFMMLLQVQQRKRLQARMEALRAQINPHFMSNSLNAIENLVNRNENDAAAKYLIHFSRLSRKILSSSRNAITTLNEELKTLEHFLALEQLRFKDKLQYEITISDDLTPKTVRIPALILQPYVENAIWHGIKPKKGSSLLEIRAEKEGKLLKCTIEDDGVGRKKAQEIKEQSILVKHKSQGMKITEERLERIGKVKGSKVEIIDLYNEKGEPRGTRVIIRLPYREVES